MPQLDLRFAQSRRGFLRASTSLAAASALAIPLTAWALPQGKHLRTAILVPEADNTQTLVAEFLAAYRHPDRALQGDGLVFLVHKSSKSCLVSIFIFLFILFLCLAVVLQKNLYLSVL